MLFRSDTLCEHGLNVHVDVLVVQRELHLVGLNVGQDGLQTLNDLLGLVLLNDPLLAQHGGMGDGSGDVLLVKPGVEANGRVKIVYYKIAILSSIVCRKQVDFENVYTEGITGVTAEDFAYAAKLGVTIKLVAKSCVTADGMYVMVTPRMLRYGKPLASVHDVVNAVCVKNGVHQCDAAGILRAFRDAVSEFRFHDRQSGAGCTVLYSGGQRGAQHPVQPECIFRRTGYCGEDHE